MAVADPETWRLIKKVTKKLEAYDKRDENFGESEKITCVLCGAEIVGFKNSNDPWPLAKGRCCNRCNMEKVIPARIAQMNFK